MMLSCLSFLACEGAKISKVLEDEQEHVDQRSDDSMETGLSPSGVRDRRVHNNVAVSCRIGQ